MSPAPETLGDRVVPYHPSMRWLLALYSRRIVNVNVNIIIAGLLSMLLTLIPVHLTHYFTDRAAVIVAITFAADLVIDVLIYYALHWLANHWPRKRAAREAVPLDQAARPSFFKDATLVQFERALLSPILYAIFMGLQFYLLRQGVAREWATVVGLMSGILTARVLHTIWMVRQGSRQRAGAAAAEKARLGELNACGNGGLADSLDRGEPGTGPSVGSIHRSGAGVGT